MECDAFAVFAKFSYVFSKACASGVSTVSHSLTNTELDAHDVFLFYDVLLLDDQCIRVMRLIARSCYCITMLVIISVWLSCMVFYSCVQRSITVMRCYTKDWSSGTYSLQNSCCFSVFKSCIYSIQFNLIQFSLFYLCSAISQQMLSHDTLQIEQV